MSVQDLMVLRGRVAAEPVVHLPEDPEGQLFARFRMAATRSRRRDNGTWEEVEPSWFTIKAWGSLARHIQHSFRVGSPVIVIGRPAPQAWVTKDGEVKAELAIHAITAGHDMVFGVSAFHRFQRDAPRAAEVAEGEVVVEEVPDELEEADDISADQLGEDELSSADPDDAPQPEVEEAAAA